MLKSRANSMSRVVYSSRCLRSHRIRPGALGKQVADGVGRLSVKQEFNDRRDTYNGKLLVRNSSNIGVLKTYRKY